MNNAAVNTYIQGVLHKSGERISGLHSLKRQDTQLPKDLVLARELVVSCSLSFSAPCKL